jgi:hypothetical protein
MPDTALVAGVRDNTAQYLLSFDLYYALKVKRTHRDLYKNSSRVL